MPNIQIRGFSILHYISFDPDSGWRCAFPGEPLAIRTKIEQIVQDMGLGSDSVVEIVPTIITSCDGKRTFMPYLRICDTNKERMRRIVKAFKKANISMDVEELLLSRFTLAKNMRRK